MKTGNIKSKLDVIRIFEKDDSKVKVGQDLSLRGAGYKLYWNTLWIENQRKEASVSFNLNCTMNREVLMVEMECLLLLWNEDRKKEKLKHFGWQTS